MQLVRTFPFDFPDYTLRSLLCFVVVILATIAAAPATDGAEITVVPSITVGEEYDDNIFLVPMDQTADFITHAVPGIRAAYESPLSDWQLEYAYDRRYYARTDLDDYVQRMILKGELRIVPDLLFFKVEDYAGRTSLSSIQDYTKQSPVQYQTNYNTLELKPYAVLQLTSRTTLTTGYVYRNIWYADPAAIDQTVYSPYGDLSWMLTETSSLNASVQHERIETARGTRTRMSSLVGPYYEYQDGSFLWGRIGPSRTTYENDQSVASLLWDAGIAHRLTSMMTLSVETGRSWIQDPLIIDRREDRIVALLRSEKERTAAGLSLAARYYGTVRYYTDERKYTSSVNFSHMLAERLKASYAVAINRYERYPANALDSMTIVWQTDVRFDYHATKELTLSLSYQHTDSYSAQNYFDNYWVNRVWAYALMTF